MKSFTLLFLVILLITSCSQNKTAFIDVGVLMKEYEGLKALDNEIKEEQDKLRMEIKSLIEPYQVKVDTYYKNVAKMSAKTRSETESALQKEQKAIDQLQDKYMEQLEKMRIERLEAINNEIAEYVKGFAKSRGIQLVLGSTGTETVIYGEDKLDITQEVLTGLNKLFVEE